VIAPYFYDPSTRILFMTASPSKGASIHPLPVPSRPLLSEGSGDEVLRVLRNDGTLDPHHNPHLSDEQVIALYCAMARTRFLDERLVTLQRQGRIGFHVGSMGEEATIVGSAFALRPSDWIFPCYREFGAALLRGLPLQTYMNNMFGNAHDTVKGRQMPDHYTCRQGHFVSISSPIGTQITQAVGFSWAAKKRREDLVALTFFGDGATSSPEFHSGMNFAGVFKTPTVFLCRNNGWAISIPTHQQTASETFGIKAVAYGMPYLRCDGNDAFAVIAAVRKAIAHASAGRGPMLIEALTYRLSGHSTSDDPKAYREEADVERWRQTDPLLRLREHLEHNQLWNRDQHSSFEDNLEKEFLAAVAQAEAAPSPSVDSMFDDVYAQLPWHLREQRGQLQRLPRAIKHG